MSISVSSITSTGRVGAASAETPALVNADRQPAAAPAETLDQATQQPLPPRFPWLSRLSLQLEAASHQRAAFTPAPILGDHIDQSA